LGAKLAREGWESFRSRSVYFQLKVLVLIGYLGIVFATIVWAPPSSLAKNQIGARILVLEGDVVVGRYFVIYNESRTHWQNVRFEIDGGFTVQRDVVGAGEKVTLYVKDFKRVEVRRRRGHDIEKRVSAPIASELTALSVHTDQGEAVAPVPPLRRSEAVAP
jgi:hypothetical protein